MMHVYTVCVCVCARARVCVCVRERELGSAEGQAGRKSRTRGTVQPPVQSSPGAWKCPRFCEPCSNAERREERGASVWR